MRNSREVRRFGDSALIARVGSVGDAHRLAASLEDGAWEGVEDVIVGDRSVTVLADPRAADLESLLPELAALPLGVRHGRTPRTLEVPVAFDGPDLDEVAKLAGATPRQVIDLLVGTELEAAFLGFSPGFAYLRGLPTALAGLSRRGSPRSMVQSGSVGLGGGFAAIYPQQSPGGWLIVGRTNLRLFDPQTPPFALIQAGDRVRFVEAHLQDPMPLPRRAPLRSTAERVLEVHQPGILSLVEDKGRRAVASLGVPRAGGADPFSLRLSNRLVGNDDDAAAIEVTGIGPGLRAGAAMHVAVVGDVDLFVDDLPVPSNTVLPLAPGQLLRAGTVKGTSRAYVAFGGGLDVPPVLGSRSTDTLCGLGCGPLRTGDVIGLGSPTRPRGWLNQPTASQGPVTLRVLAGPEDFDHQQVAGLTAATWIVGVDSDRVGVRLAGPPLRPPSAGIASQGMVTGALQVPPDGCPIALMCDHATVGGYPVIATVVSADLGLLGQLRPGDEARFEIVTQSEALAALAAAERALEGRIAGHYPLCFE